MPSGGVLAAVAVAGMLYFAGAAVVHGAKKVGHGIKVGVTRLVHPHRHTSPDHDGRPADNFSSEG